MKTRLLGPLIALAIGLAWPSVAFSACTGNFAAGTVCGNPGASVVPPVASTLSLLFDRNFGAPSPTGSILNRGSSTWGATITPVIGNPGTSTGSLGLGATAGGTATIASPNVVGNTNFKLPPSNGTAGQVLSTDGAGNTSWIPSLGGGSVVSVGLSLPGSVFSVTGSPVTSSGTLTGSFISQTANSALMGPASGVAAAPTFRLLIGADLPAPTISALGGVQANNPVASKWINAINIAGVPQLSQPAFSDISGSIAPSQCVTPTATTLGCVRSYAAVASQWINTISNSGIPSSTQPQFSDIAGQVATSQLPVISNNAVLSNITGVTATPVGNSLSTVMDSSFDNSQGDILYRSATGWTFLAPGVLGQVLQTSGNGANPVWATVSGTGTVVSVGAAGGLTSAPNPIVSSGTITLANIPNGTVLANTSGVSNLPVATSISTAFDVLGSTEGDVLYRGAAVWAALPPGTSGQFLQTQGSGATPQWASVANTLNGLSGNLVIGPVVSSIGTVITLPVPPPRGRLTLQSGTPVMTTTHANVSGIFYDCYLGGNTVPVFTGTVDTLLPIPACEISTTLQSSGPGLVSNTNVFDVWAFNNSGVLGICVATNGTGGGWASDGGSNTARGTGYSQLDTTTRPYITNANSVSHCYNGATDFGSSASNRLTYLGTFYATAAGQTSWSYGASGAPPTIGCFCIWNVNNRVSAATVFGDSRANWTYASLTVREADATNNAGSFRMRFVTGLAQDAWSASYASFGSGSGDAIMGVCFNVTNAFSGGVGIGINGAGSGIFTASSLGLGFVSACESTFSTMTFQGFNTTLGTQITFLQYGGEF